MSTARSTEHFRRKRPLVVGSVSPAAAAGIAALAAARGVALSRVLESAINLALDSASPSERAAIEAAAKTPLKPACLPGANPR